ncbi:MAG: hypothetical protein AAFU67_12520, partial [Bacteroidota bacterium]
RQTILVTLLTGILMGLILMYLKFNNPQAAFTHTMNEIRYFVNCGIVIVICSAVLLIAPFPPITLAAFLASAPINVALKLALPEMNYFLRAGVVIVGIFMLFQVFGQLIKNQGEVHWRSWKSLLQPADKNVAWVGLGLALSLMALHIVFH